MTIITNGNLWSFRGPFVFSTALKCAIKCTSEHHKLKNEKFPKNIEDVWDSSIIHRVSYAITLSGCSYFYPKYNCVFNIFLGGRCSPKGGAPPFSPIGRGWDHKIIPTYNPKSIYIKLQCPSRHGTYQRFSMINLRSSLASIYKIKSCTDSERHGI